MPQAAKGLDFSGHKITWHTWFPDTADLLRKPLCAFSDASFGLLILFFYPSPR